MVTRMSSRSFTRKMRLLTIAAALLGDLVHDLAQGAAEGLQQVFFVVLPHGADDPFTAAQGVRSALEGHHALDAQALFTEPLAWSASGCR